MPPDVTRIDVLAGEAHFVDHLAPVYLALPEDRRGDFLVRRTSQNPIAATLRARARSRGVPDVVLVPNNQHAERGHPVLVSSWADMHFAHRQRRSPIARMEHGIGQSFANSRHPSYAGGTGAEMVGLFLVPNTHAGGRWQSAYPAARVEVVGSPRLDDLPQREPHDTDDGRPVIALSFHWGTPSFHHGSLAETRGSFAEYAPVLAELAGKFHVIGHGHPRQLAKMERTYRRAGIEVVPDFAEVCRRADVLAIDTNSCLFEFAATGRPVVTINAKHFRRDIEHGLRFWEAATVGVQCDSPGGLVAAIRAALRDSEAQQRRREAALDIVFQPRTGGAALAAAALVSWADSFSPVDKAVLTG